MTRTSNGRSARAPRMLCASLLLMACLAAPRAAMATDPPPAVKADLSKQAQWLVDDGLAAIKAGQLEKARALLLGAFRAQKHWRIAPHLGNVELKLGRMRDAAEHIALFLREGKDIDPADRKQAEAMLAEARSNVGVLTVNADPPGAEIRVDGEIVGTAPLAAPVFVDPGSHRVEVRADGHMMMSTVTSVVAKGDERVDMKLVPIPNAETIQREGALTTPPKSGPSAVLLALGASSAIAAASLGVGFTVAAFAKKSERSAAANAIDTNPTCRTKLVQCPDTVLTADRGFVTFAYAAMYSYIAATALGAGTLIYGVASRSKPGDTRASIMVGPRSAAVGVTVSW